MKFVLFKLPIPREDVRKLFRAGLSFLEGKLVYRRNPKVKPAVSQPDAKLKYFINNVRMVDGKPTTKGPEITEVWRGGGNFTEEYTAKLEQAFLQGRADEFLAKNKIEYFDQGHDGELKKTISLQKNYIAALDDFRPYLLAMRLARELIASLRFEKNKDAAVYYLRAMQLSSKIKPLVILLRKETSDAALIKQVGKMASEINKVKLVPLRWEYETFLREMQSELEAFNAAKSQNSKLRQLDRLHVFFKSVDFSDPNNSKAQQIKAAVFIKKNLSIKATEDLSTSIRQFIDKPDWAGQYQDILASTKAIPLFVLQEYSAGTRYLNVLMNRGTPQVINDLYEFYRVTCLEETSVCRPDFGHYVLRYEAQAFKNLNQFQDKALQKIHYTTKVKELFLSGLKKYFKNGKIKKIISQVGNIKVGLNGKEVKKELVAIIEKAEKKEHDRLVLSSRLIRYLLEAVHESGQAYLELKSSKPTVRATEAKKILEKTFREIGIPLRKPGDPVKKGWLVEVTPTASAASAVLTLKRLVLLRKLKGDPVVFTKEEVLSTLPVHEMFHVLRAESGRASEFALLTAGVSRFLDIEEGLAAILERLSLPGLLAQRRMVQALRYYGASLALKNNSPTDERSTYTWQEIYDILGAFGLMDETFEALRRLIRLTDGRRIPKNVNLRDVVYFRGIQKIEEWIPEVFGAQIFDHIWRDEYKRKTLSDEEQKEIVSKIKTMYKSPRYQQHFAASAIVALLNELMVGKVTPEFVRLLKQRGHYKPPMYKIELKKKNEKTAIDIMRSKP